MYQLFNLLLVILMCNTSQQFDLSWESIIRNRPTTNTGETTNSAQRTSLASIKVEHVFTKRPIAAAVTTATTTSSTQSTTNIVEKTTVPGASVNIDETMPERVMSTTSSRKASLGTIKLSDIFKNHPTLPVSVPKGRVTIRPTATSDSNEGNSDNLDILKHHGYCCKKGMVMQSENRTRVVKITKIETVQLIIGYKSCLTGGNSKTESGSRQRRYLFWSGGKDKSSKSDGNNQPTKLVEGRGCPIFKTENIPIEEYTTETFQVPINIMQCVSPITCCEGYIRRPNGQCQHGELLSKYKDTLAVLERLGLVG